MPWLYFSKYLWLQSRNNIGATRNIIYIEYYKFNDINKRRIMKRRINKNFSLSDLREIDQLCPEGLMSATSFHFLQRNEVSEEIVNVLRNRFKRSSASFCKRYRLKNKNKPNFIK